MKMHDQVFNEEAMVARLRYEVYQVLVEYFKDHPLPGRHVEDQRYLSRREVAKYLGIALSTVDHWTRLGRLTKIKIGNTARFDKEEIDAKLERLQKHSRVV